MDLDERDVSLQKTERSTTPDLLAGAQFLDIGWVVLNQFRDHPGLAAGPGAAWSPRAISARRCFSSSPAFWSAVATRGSATPDGFHYGAFLWRRLSFTYPLHVAVLATMAVLVALAAPSARLRPLRYLGRLPIAMTLIYLPVDIAYFRALHLVFGTPRGTEAWLIWAAVFPAIAIAAVVAHHAVQRPIWLWLRAHRPFEPSGGATSPGSP